MDYGGTLKDLEEMGILKFDIKDYIDKGGLKKIESELRKALLKKRKEYNEFNESSDYLHWDYQRIMNDCRQFLCQCGLSTNSTDSLESLFNAGDEYESRKKTINSNWAGGAAIGPFAHLLLYGSVITCFLGAGAGYILGENIASYFDASKFNTGVTGALGVLTGGTLGFTSPALLLDLPDLIPNKRKKRLKGLHSQNIERFIKEVDGFIFSE